MTPILKPQRLLPSPSPGTLLKRPFAVAQRMRLKEVSERDPVYLSLIRQLPCLHCGMEPAGEAAHLCMASGAHGKASGIGKTPADRWALPLCGEHHRLAQRAQYNIGERAFWSEIGIDPFLTAERLYAARGDVVAMRVVVMLSFVERAKM
ncbi:MAG: hypothetical protein WBR29_07410 [Gammaproteobacteria bacterium]